MKKGLLSTFARIAILLPLFSIGANVQAETPANRQIVSLGGSITEILYEMGLQDQIAAVDVTSVYPPAALKEKPNVGYIRQLSAEGVLAVNPDIILSEADAGPVEAVDSLKAASVPFVMIPAAYNAQGIIDKIDQVGQALGEEEKATRLASRVKGELDRTARIIGSLPQEKKKKVLFILTVRDGRLMVAGRGSHADGIIKMAGGINLMQSVKGYKEVDNEALLSNPPDAILMMRRNEHAASDDMLAAHPALKASPAITNHQIIRMDGMYLLGFGPRTASAVSDLARQLYPDHVELVSLSNEIAGKEAKK